MYKKVRRVKGQKVNLEEYDYEKNSIKEFLFGLDQTTAMEETLDDDILAEFQRLSTMYSDDEMMVECRVQSIECDV